MVGGGVSLHRYPRLTPLQSSSPSGSMPLSSENLDGIAAPRGVSRRYLQAAPVSPGCFATPSPRADAEALQAAREMGLTARPSSPQTTALIANIVAGVVAGTPRRNAVGPRTLPKLHLAVGAIVGDVLACWAKTPPALAFRVSTEAAFTGEAVSYTYFRMALDGMSAAGLIHRHSGVRFQRAVFDAGSGLAARYWPTETLLAAAGAHGIHPGNLAAHFVHVFPTTPPKIVHPILLRPFPTQSLRRPNAAPPDYRDGAARQARAEVEALNTYAAAFNVEGCRPPRFRRRFSGALGLHGRCYAGGSANYQGLSKRQRVETLSINGEQVCELDVKASWLTVLHGLHGLPLPAADLYELPGVPREVAKVAVVASLGKGSLVRQWSPVSLRNYPECAGYSAKAVATALVSRYPFLADLAAIVAHLPPHLRRASGVIPAFLMGVEARAVTAAMLHVQKYAQTLALPMHDAVIVPLCAEEIGRAGLMAGFKEFAGLVPMIEVLRGPGGDE